MLARGVSGVSGVAVALVLLACSDGADDPLDPVTLEGIGDGDPARDVRETVDVAGAGTIDVEVGDGALRLVDVVPADGWRERSRHVDDDGIEVALVRDAGGEATLEVERDGQGIRVTYELEVGPVDAGTLSLGAAGELALAMAAGELVLEELRLASDWEVVDDGRDDDEVEIELASGDQRLEIVVELDDGDLAVDVGYDSGRL